MTATDELRRLLDERTDVSAPCEVWNDALVERCRRLAGERG